MTWRTATTPTGPMAGNASDPVAAPSCVDRALATRVAVPFFRSDGPVLDVLMKKACARSGRYEKCIEAAIHAFNA